MLAYEDCARAMYQSWSVLGLGLAVFALSSFVPTQRFGAMMFCLLTAALIGNLMIAAGRACAVRSRHFFGRGLMRKGRGSPGGRSGRRVGRRIARRTIRPGSDCHRSSQTGDRSGLASSTPTGLGMGSAPMGPAAKGSPATGPTPFRHDAPHRSSHR